LFSPLAKYESHRRKSAGNEMTINCVRKLICPLRKLGLGSKMRLLLYTFDCKHYPLLGFSRA